MRTVPRRHVRQRNSTDASDRQDLRPVLHDARHKLRSLRVRYRFTNDSEGIAAADGKVVRSQQAGISEMHIHHTSAGLQHNVRAKWRHFARCSKGQHFAEQGNFPLYLIDRQIGICADLCLFLCAGRSHHDSGH